VISIVAYCQNSLRMIFRWGSIGIVLIISSLLGIHNKSFLFLRVASYCVCYYNIWRCSQSQQYFMIVFIFFLLFLFSFCFVPTTCFGPYGPPSGGIYTSQSLEAIMPTTDPFLLGYTIVIYIGFVFGKSIVGFLYVWGGYNFVYVITFLQY
jgi:hypothetical protein